MNNMLKLLTFLIFMGSPCQILAFEEKKLEASSLKNLKKIGKAIKIKNNESKKTYVILKEGKDSPKININPETPKKNSSLERGNLKMEIKSPNDLKTRLQKEKAMEMAYVAYHSGQISSALNLYERILQDDPKNLEALFSVATIFHEEGNYEEAKKNYGKILEIKPGHLPAINNYLALISGASPAEALREFRKLEAANPKMAIIPAQIGMLYFKQGNSKKAILNLVKAVNLDPENREYRYNLAILYDLSGNVADAVNLYQQILKMKPQNQENFLIEEVSERLSILREGK